MPQKQRTNAGFSFKNQITPPRFERSFFVSSCWNISCYIYSLFSPFVGSESNSFYFGNSRRDVSFCGIICSLMACILRAFLLCSVFAFFMYGTELFAIWPIILSTLLCILLLTYGVIFFKNRTKNQFQKKPRKAYTTKDIINGKHIKK